MKINYEGQKFKFLKVKVKTTSFKDRYLNTEISIFLKKRFYELRKRLKMATVTPIRIGDGKGRRLRPIG